jgi:betaine lipid synthase
MGKGGEASASGITQRKPLLKRASSSFNNLKSDLNVLRSIWLKPLAGTDHAARLENFYGPQAQAYDNFRTNFLWGRERLVQSVAARLDGKDNLVWVDLGGGTAENVKMMSKYMDLSKFAKIYVVDLTPSLCKVAAEKALKEGWTNVEVVEADATTFEIPNGIKADCVTFSYSLTMIPPFHAAVDNAAKILAPDGICGVADFYVSSKYDLPCRQMNSTTRWFWRTCFDTDNIDLGPERRNYLDHVFQRVWEYNGRGSIPYVPLFKAPYFVWVGQHTQGGVVEVEAMNRRPHLFPPTFLYSLSWEDPRADEPYLKVQKGDVCLTLTSGACNAFDLVLQDADAVYCVDMNPAQSHLLEIKMVAMQSLPYEDVWRLFGEGKHPQFPDLFYSRLAPFMSGRCQDFWSSRFHYFKNGLYFYGSMGNVITFMYMLATYCGMRGWVNRLCSAPTLEDQQKIWENSYLVRFIRMLPAWFLALFAKLSLNGAVMWGCLGVPSAQASLITGDGRNLAEYVATVFHGAAMGTHLATENYFYLCCLTSQFTKKCCPKYLEEKSYKALRANNCEMLNKLHNVTGSYLDELEKRKYSKVILMDHVDWTDEKYVKHLAQVLYRQVVPGGLVIWRSASKNPWYSPFFAEAGFDVVCIERHHDRVAIDCVNMYASFWVGTRKA